MSKSAKIWLSKWIFYVKNHSNLSEFYSQWILFINQITASIGAHFLLKSFFDKFNFWTTLFFKIMPNFWIHKVEWFPLSMLIFGQKILLFRTQTACYEKTKYSLTRISKVAKNNLLGIWTGLLFTSSYSSLNKSLAILKWGNMLLSNVRCNHLLSHEKVGMS